MKTLNIITIISFCLIIITTGCTRHRYPQQLILADSIAVTNPDSCIKLLKKIGQTIHTASEKDMMYYNLIKVKAQNHAYIKPDNDSVISDIIEYYENEGDKQMLPAAYFYAGRIYEELNNYPQAMEFFQKTLKLVENAEDNNEYLRIKDKTYCQLGYIFYEQWLDDNALSMFNKSYEISKLRKDTTGMIFNLRDIAIIYNDNNNTDSVIHYYNKALSLSEKQNNKEMYANICGMLSYLYVTLKQYNKAEKYLQYALTFADPNDQDAIMYISAEIYNAKGEKDSAKHIYEDLIRTGSIKTKQSSYKSLAKYYSSKGDINNALYNFMLCEHYFDSLQRVIATEKIAQMDALFNHEQQEKENLSLKIESKKKDLKYTVIIFTAILIIIILLTIILYNRFKNKIQKYKFEKFNPLIQHTQKEKEEKINESYIYKHIKSLINNPNAKKRLTDDEWEQLRITINDIYKGFDDKLSELCKMSTLDYRVCLLLKIKIPLTNIAELMNKTNVGISSIRTKLYQRAFGEKKGTKAWDDIIASL